jgi:hypothetical protein
MAAQAQLRAPDRGLQSAAPLGIIEIPLPQPSLRKSRGFIRSEDGLYVSTKVALQGARATLLAIGLEAAAVGCVLCDWLVRLAAR